MTNLSLGGLIIGLCIVSAFVGWTVIELIIWLCSFIHISIG